MHRHIRDMGVRGARILLALLLMASISPHACGVQSRLPHVRYCSAGGVGDCCCYRCSTNGSAYVYLVVVVVTVVVVVVVAVVVVVVVVVAVVTGHVD